MTLYMRNDARVEKDDDEQVMGSIEPESWSLHADKDISHLKLMSLVIICSFLKITNLVKHIFKTLKNSLLWLLERDL